jgi:TolB-like protein/DNA-binding winged helix-turn-helix (wHTH) protein/Tfp pilus assembly protein PilF
MSLPVSTSRRFAFGPFEADLHSGELRKHGRRIRLQSQPFQILAMLLERPGQLVTREEICQKLWSADTFVDFDHSLGTAINKIREVLCDSAVKPRFLETLPRRGYRFIADVTPIDPDPVPVLVPQEVPVASVGEPSRRRTLSLFLGAGLIVTLLVAALIAWSRDGRRWWPASLPTHPQVSSIAVLPLLNLSNDPDQQFFADGMTDVLTTDLAQISSLRVISRSSAMAYLGTHKSASQIARELGVDALVEGSVERFGNKIRITTQLIHAGSDRHLWAHTYDRELSDVLVVQDEVAHEIAGSISLRLTDQEQVQLSRPNVVSPEVALLYFKGSCLLSKMEALPAKVAFEEAVRLAPDSAEAWAGLADAQHTLGVLGDNQAFPQAREAANRALRIDNSQAQALMVLGVVSFLYDWNPSESEAFFRRSLAARPSYAMAHALFANTLAHRGKFEEAFQHIKLASELDPVSVLTNSFGWHVYFCARRYDDALRLVQGISDVDPSFSLAYGRLIISWEQKGEYLKAIDASLQNNLLRGETPEQAQRQALEFRSALASGGPPAYWKYKLDTLIRETPPRERYGAPFARCYMHIGKREEALEALEKAYQAKDPFLIFWLPIHEEFDPLRPDPRFQKMLRGFGIS